MSSASLQIQPEAGRPRKLRFRIGLARTSGVMAVSCQQTLPALPLADEATVKPAGVVVPPDLLAVSSTSRTA